MTESSTWYPYKPPDTYPAGPEGPGPWYPHPFEENPPAPAQSDDQVFWEWDTFGQPHYLYEDEDGTVHDVWYMHRGDGTWRIYEEWMNPAGEVRTSFSDPPYGEWNAGQLHGWKAARTEVDPNDPNPPDFLFTIPPDLPPGLTFHDHEEYPQRNDIVHHHATDQYGRTWHWFRDFDGEYVIDYYDQDGLKHIITSDNGTWRDTWTDANGNEHSGLWGVEDHEAGRWYVGDDVGEGGHTLPEWTVGGDAGAGPQAPASTGNTGEEWVVKPGGEPGGGAFRLPRDSMAYQSYQSESGADEQGKEEQAGTPWDDISDALSNNPNMTPEEMKAAAEAASRTPGDDEPEEEGEMRTLPAYPGEEEEGGVPTLPAYPSEEEEDGVPTLPAYPSEEEGEMRWLPADPSDDQGQPPLLDPNATPVPMPSFPDPHEPIPDDTLETPPERTLLSTLYEDSQSQFPMWMREVAWFSLTPEQAQEVQQVLLRVASDPNALTDPTVLEGLEPPQPEAVLQLLGRSLPLPPGETSLYPPVELDPELFPPEVMNQIRQQLDDLYEQNPDLAAGLMSPDNPTSLPPFEPVRPEEPPPGDPNSSPGPTFDPTIAHHPIVKDPLTGEWIVKDMATGEWRNAEPGEIPDPGEGGEEGGVARTPTGETGGTPTAPPETNPPPVNLSALTLEQLQALTDLTPGQLQALTGLTPGQLQEQLQGLGCLEGVPPPGDDGGGFMGLGVPYQDYISFYPMGQDPTTGQWRNAEPGEIPEVPQSSGHPNAPEEGRPPPTDEPVIRDASTTGAPAVPWFDVGETVGPTSFEEATSDALLNPTDPDAPAGDEGQPESHPSYPSPWPYGEEVSPTEEEVGSFLQPSGAATGQGGLTEDPYLTESPSTVPPDAQDQEDFFEGV